MSECNLSELLFCPFCGSEPTLSNDFKIVYDYPNHGDEFWTGRVCCRCKCGASTKGHQITVYNDEIIPGESRRTIENCKQYPEAEAKAKSSWNTRSSS